MQGGRRDASLYMQVITMQAATSLYMQVINIQEGRKLRHKE
jgi:hypothetical protein